MSFMVLKMLNGILKPLLHFNFRDTEVLSKERKLDREKRY